MRIGHVIGRVTLSQKDPAYKGGRFYLVMPADRAQLERGTMEPLARGDSVVMFDDMGAAPGDLVAFSEGGEACQAFGCDTAVDAYNCMILEKLHYSPPVKETA